MRELRKHHCVFLFANLLSILIVYPYLYKQQILLNTIFTAILFTSLYAIAINKIQFLIGLLFGLPWLAATIMQIFIAEYFHQEISLGLRIFSNVISIVFMAYISISLLLYIVRAPVVDKDVIFAAISLFILIGIAWGALYAIVELLYPGSYHLASPMPLMDGRFEWYHFLYFSFVTIATLGYGDITPLTPQAQSLVILEAMTGLFYIALLVSRLVGVYAPQPSPNNANNSNDSNPGI
ncbi:MAG: ion channel [Candidatus Omnitrophota bacterium]